jgi:hypothetical protein
MIAALTRACDAGDRLEIEAELARWIPSYVPDVTLRTAVRH